MKKIFFICLMIFPLFTFSSEKTISYGSKETPLEGYLVQPKKKNGKAILIVHNWMGVTDGTKEKARELAALGYTAFAADIYGKGIRPKDPKEAAEQAGLYKKNRVLFRERLNLAYNELKKITGAPDSKIAAIGFCFGGTGVLELARSGTPVSGVVSFHGGLDSPEPTLGKNIKSKILVLHGADDPYISESDFKAFETELKTHHVDYQIISYSGAVHSFTDKTAGSDPSKGAAYDEKTAKRSWKAMKSFFDEL